MNDDQIKPANLGRHKRKCSICQHEQREEIETAFMAWNSPERIAKDHAGIEPSSVYRHAHALGLIEKRRHNIREPLERIIEQWDKAKISASAIVSAVQTLVKINARDESIDRREEAHRNSVFDRMSREELEIYARDGVLPAWVAETIHGSSSQQEFQA